MALVPDITRSAGRPRQPRPPAPSPTFLLMGLGRILREDVDTALRGAGLSLRRLSALGHLHHQPGLSYSELGRRTEVTTQSVQATLAHLEQLGAVERRTAPGRGRTAQLHVTDEGVALMRRGQRLVEEAGQRVLAPVPADQQAQLTAVLLQAFTAAVQRKAPPPQEPTP